MRMAGIVERISDSAPDVGAVKVALTMGFALLFGVLAVCVSLWGNGTIWNGLLWSGAWSSVGWFLGFLFGIPRFLSTDTARTQGAPGMEAARQHLSAEMVATTTLRATAESALNVLREAEASAKEQQQKADDASRLSEAAEAAAASDPSDAALKADAESKTRSAVAALEASKAASQKAADTGARASEAANAAKNADTALEAMKRKVEAEAATASAARGSSMTVNTNLEQVSDWLTKIIIGVSLVESQSLLAKMNGAATFMARSMVKTGQAMPCPNSPAPGFGETLSAASDAAVDAAAVIGDQGCNAVTEAARALEPFYSMESFAYALMLYFLVTGLLGSYLLTRLFLQRVLDNAANSTAI